MVSPYITGLAFCLSTTGCLFQNERCFDVRQQRYTYLTRFPGTRRLWKRNPSIGQLSANLKIQAFQRLPLLPVAPSEGGVLFPECKAIVQVSGEDELSSLRSIEAERLPLFGYCTVDEAGEMYSVGTMALLENVHWASVVSEEEDGDVLDLDEQIAICSCIGVQRFKILEVEQLKPFPVARVQLFCR
uniref:Lon N-terminal domain-containing protein n=1 Tax=Hanusia phi TaxID=3032 RepID=A0A7S0HUK2_9CRYP|mmetsp:Transcript_36840/g.83059  ORF Transcript_36840/g.83059 Transcript_36840/m.83059 type:complete len:187 (+) Transcript_36840:59-619(+)